MRISIIASAFGTGQADAKIRHYVAATPNPKNGDFQPLKVATSSSLIRLAGNGGT
jgi:hypothetical protein